MLHRNLLASVGVVALAGAAAAADLPSRAPPPVYVPPAPIFSWTGIYIGGQVGYAFGTLNTSVTAFPLPTVANSFTANGVIGGAHVGYNAQINQWVVGVEGSVDGTSIDSTVQVGGLPFTGKLLVEGSIRGRLGVAWDRLLLYATGGVAFGGFESIYPPVLPPSTTVSVTRTGWTAGGGVEYALNNNWSLRAEYRYTDFGSYTDFPASFLDIPVRRHFTHHVVQGGFSYKFDLAPPAPVVAKY
jgi:outer membrane immunogenic protein